MKPVFEIAWREYKQYIFSRGFLLFLVMFPLGVLFAAGSISLIEKNRPIRHYVVYDETGAYADLIDSQIGERQLRQTIMALDLYTKIAIDPAKATSADLPYPYKPDRVSNARVADFAARGGLDAALDEISPYLLSGAPPFVDPAQQFVRLDLPPEIANAPNGEAAADLLRPFLLGDADFPGAGKSGLFAAIVIPKNFSATGGGEAQYWSRNLTDPSLEIVIRRALSASLQREKAERFGLNAAQLDAIADTEAPLSVFDPETGPEGGVVEDDERLRTALLPSALTYMLLVVIFGVGNLLLTNTIEERSNKIVETLLSSVTADQLMIGKLIGIAAVGLTMPVVLLLGSVGVTLAGVSASEAFGDALLHLVQSNLIPIYLFYFLCAYVIFAMIFLAIGAMSNSLQDAQSFMGPIMILVFLPLPFMVMVFESPNGVVATAMTWIPLYTPYAVMMRAAADPPLWEIVGATILMLIFASVLARYMGRIFRSAILQSAPPQAKDIWRLARKDAD